VLEEGATIMGIPAFAAQRDAQPPTKPGQARVGRPRAFQDEDVYRVMTNVISDVGYSGLTFALIAAQIKCTTSALIRRFGDKRSLVQGFILWLADQQETAFQDYRDKQVSPLNILRGRWFIPATPDAEVEKVIHQPELFLTFFIEARSDPAYRPQLAKLDEHFESEVAKATADAVAAGELADCDTTELAHTLNCAMTGAMSLWLDQPRTPFAQAMERTFNAVIEPYLPKGKR
jgi:AcrR family transcriptional regulator